MTIDPSFIKSQTIVIRLRRSNGFFYGAYEQGKPLPVEISISPFHVAENALKMYPDAQALLDVEGVDLPAGTEDWKAFAIAGRQWEPGYSHPEASAERLRTTLRAYSAAALVQLGLPYAKCEDAVKQIPDDSDFFLKAYGQYQASEIVFVDEQPFGLHGHGGHVMVDLAVPDPNEEGTFLLSNYLHGLANIGAEFVHPQWQNDPPHGRFRVKKSNAAETTAVSA